MWVSLLTFLATILFLVVLGRRLGKTLFSTETQGVATALGALCSLAVFSILGTIVYYVATVNVFSLGIAALIGTIVILVATQNGRFVNTSDTRDTTWSLSTFVLIILGVIALGAWWVAVTSVSITDAVRSPWIVLSPVAIIAPATALVASVMLFSRQAKTAGSILLFATLSSLFSSAAVLFPLGYGFDPFLHRATVAHIAEYGTITPKPFYYIGQYVLELYTHFISGLSIFTIDTLLVPVIAALTFVVAFRRLPIGVTILLLALSNFTTTTPQSLAYLFGILTVIATPKNIEQHRDLIAPSIFAIAAFLTHPIAGVPAIMFVLLLVARKFRILQALVAVGAALALPVMFIAQATMSGAPITVTLHQLWRLDTLPLDFFVLSNGNTWLDALYLILGNATIIILTLAIIGAFATKHIRSLREHAGGVMTIALLVSFIIVSLGLNFTYLIDYERQDFALRFLMLASIFALPLAEQGLAHLGSKLPRASVSLQWCLLFVLACATTYGLYPRHDGYTRSAAFNVSQADINTVYAIHNLEKADADYIVLSNQATAAAALQEFGFRKYYHTDIFYYPIPTGGVLYQSYLSMVEQTPSRKTVQQAMNIAGVDKAYFVVSDYWWRKDAIIENAKQQTDNWFAVDGGKTTIFVFTSDEVSQSLQ
ncbi:MAG: hypothetical protein AAB839_01140 [Patescibacteria group bacterium]